MSYAYDEMYLHLAQRVLGDMFDYAVNTLKYGLREFYSLFVGCGMAEQFEQGNPTYVAGMNGCEVSKEVIRRAGLPRPDVPDVMYVDKSQEYWIGWSLAYYQWYSGKHFSDIDSDIGIEEMYNLYPTCHEADISVLIDIMDSKIKKNAYLKRMRAYAGLSQSQLAAVADVPIRQIQLFEQGKRDITKTQGDTLKKLARAMNCKIEDLI